MPILKILMIGSSSNSNRYHYFPIDSTQDLINEIAEVSYRMKTVLYKGIVETNIHKFTYQHYIPKESAIEDEDAEIGDHPIIIICSDKSYKDNKIDMIFKEIFEGLNEINLKDAKITNEVKSKIAKVFLKYQNMNNIKENDINEAEFGVIEEFIGFDKTGSSSSRFYESSDTINDPKKRSKLRNMEKKKREEIENLKKWRTVKCFYLFISIILLMATISSIFIFWNDLFGEIK